MNKLPKLIDEMTGKNYCLEQIRCFKDHYNVKNGSARVREIEGDTIKIMSTLARDYRNVKEKNTKTQSYSVFDKLSQMFPYKAHLDPG